MACRNIGWINRRIQIISTDNQCGSYDINTDGQLFSFSETSLVSDTPVTSQTVAMIQSLHQLSTVILSLRLLVTKEHWQFIQVYTGIPTVTAGGAGTTAVGQRTLELSVFR